MTEPQTSESFEQYVRRAVDEDQKYTEQNPGPGLKYDAGKLRTDLIPPIALARMADVCDARGMYGACQSVERWYDDAVSNLTYWRNGGNADDLAAAGVCIASISGARDVALHGRALTDVARVLMFGAVKYGEWNWERVENGKTRYYAAALRHLFAWSAGEENDPESGLPHLAHALCCVCFLIHICHGAQTQARDLQDFLARKNAEDTSRA